MSTIGALTPSREIDLPSVELSELGPVVASGQNVFKANVSEVINFNFTVSLAESIDINSTAVTLGTMRKANAADVLVQSSSVVVVFDKDNHASVSVALDAPSTKGRFDLVIKFSGHNHVRLGKLIYE
ncbi:MAG TPA: hypothetical protein DDW52_15425 [Planctomycetaceae bacterium]|nr:hypothetical protein [Planctomycetaceae bacterium]